MAYTILKISLKLTFLFFFIIGKAGYSQETVSSSKNTLNPMVFLSSEEAKQYIKNYRDKKRRLAKTHSQSIFLTKNNFCFIYDFFVKNGSNYDGIRFHMAIYKDIIATGQINKKQITLFITPTLKGDKHEPAYSAFTDFKKDNPSAGQCYKSPPMAEEIITINHGELCPESCDVTTNPTSVNHTGTLRNSGEIIILDPSTARTYKKYYKRRYYILNKFHTKSVWLHKENFMFIGDFFKNPDNKKYDGIRIFFASYHKWVDREITFQARRKQMTIILTPTIHKEPQFDDFKNYFLTYINKFSGEDKEARTGSLNHGELCPDKCPDN